MILAAAASPFVSGCVQDKDPVNYDIYPGNELYLPADGASVDLGRGADVEFQWAPSVAHDNGYVSYEILFDKADGDFSSPVAVAAGQLNGSKPYLSMTSKSLNSAARAAGVAMGQTGTLKWTVRASKGLKGSVYSVSRLLTVTTVNSMDPLPAYVTLTGSATDDPEGGIRMTPAAGIDGGAVSEGVLECFTKIKSGADFTAVDDLGRYYSFNSDGTITYSETPVASRFGSEAIYWLKADFDVMTWTAVTVTKVELYAAAWTGGNMRTARKEMEYTGKGVWRALDYENTVSDNPEKDSRHRFNATLGDGTVLYLGTPNANPGSYTTDYLKVSLYTATGVGNADWDKTWTFVESDCGRPFDAYLYLNSDNPAGGYWHEYKFK